MKRMTQKILIVTDAWHPQVNGVVTVLEEMKERLEHKGFQVSLIHPELFPIKMPLFFYPQIKLALFSGRNVRKIIQKENPDFIHIATEGPLGYAARSYCVKNGKKFTTSYHTHFPLYMKLRIGIFDIVYSYILWFHSKAVRTMVASNTLRDDLKKRGLNNIVIWPLGVDTDLFIRNSAAKVPKEFKKPIFLYAGRVAIEKNVETFLRCNLPGMKIVIGDGPQRKELEKKYGKEGVIFLGKGGYKQDQALIDLISISDVFVFPSMTETFGLSILEAMACGVPVAAYDVMGPKDIIMNGVDGYIGDNLEENAIKCFGLKAEDCRKKALMFTWEKSAEAFLENLVEIAG